MDPTEDLSARVLLRHILTTEPPRTPVTRSTSEKQSSNGRRHSKRLQNKDPQTPQELLRRSLKHKMRESVSRTSLLAPKKRTTASVVPQKTNTPAATSGLFDDGDTPRHMLRNILQTEPVRSPVVHKRAASERLEEAGDDYTTASMRPSIELSGLDLPDLTIGNAASIAKGLSRKRPRRSLNVTAFERRLREGQGEDVTEEIEDSMGDHSSLSLSSSNSLSLKTPFVDIRTERRGLQRRVSNRRKITEEEFGAAVNKRQMGGVSSFVVPDKGLSDTTHSEGFTLGLSRLSEPDITVDIVNCNTALYAEPAAMTANFSVVATQDKATVMASQLQKQMEQGEQNELEKDESVFAFPTESKAPEEHQNEEEKITTKDQAVISRPDDDEESAGDSFARSDEEEGRIQAQAEEIGDADSPHKEDANIRSQSEEEKEQIEAQAGAQEECDADSQTEEEAALISQSEKDDVIPDSQTQDEEEDAAVSEEEKEEEEEEEEEEVEEDVNSQREEDIDAASQSEEEEVAPDSQAEDECAVDSQSGEEREQDPADDGLTYSHPEDEPDGEPEEEEQRDHAIEHISRRAHRSEGGLLLPVKDSGSSGGKRRAQSDIGLHTSMETGSLKSNHYLMGVHDLAESSSKGKMEAEEQPGPEKSITLHLSMDVEDHGRLSNDSPEDAEDQEPAEEEEESEEGDEENDEIPSKTPPFVRQKLNLFRPDPLASPSVLKNIQASTSEGKGLPASKPKQVRKTRTKSTKKEGALPKSYLMGVFKHFAKTKVSADVYPVLQETMDKFFERMADDLETYAAHAGRKTIEFEDCVMLLKRQCHVNDKVPVEVLIEKYLRMDQRRLLIPIATSGNVVVPKKRK